MRTGRVGWPAGIGGVFSDQLVLDEIFLDFVAAYVGEHLVVDLDTGRQRLAALGFHFPPERRVLDDVFFGVRKIVFGEHGADAIAPAAACLEVSSDLGRIHAGNLACATRFAFALRAAKKWNELYPANRRTRAGFPVAGDRWKNVCAWRLRKGSGPGGLLHL